MKATKNPETNRYATMGMAALLPGMVHMLELMQAEIDKFRNQLAQLQEASEPAEERNPRKARGLSGWPADPEERKAEMARRMKVAAAKKKGSKLSEERKKLWASMSPAKRKKRLAAMIAGRQKKRPAEPVKLEPAA